jgi:hypothetical protein
VLILALAALAGCSSAGVPAEPPAVTAAGRLSTPATSDRPVDCPAPTAQVSTSDDLRAALSAAGPGTVIGLADGTYDGEFRATAVGTEQSPIWLCGSSRAVLRGAGVDRGVVLHLNRAANWRLLGFSVTNGQKGVLADAVTASVLQDLRVVDIGDEAVHLRADSIGNVLRGLTISRTGLSTEKFGEGIYVGSAVSNWCRVSACRPDRSDRNLLLGNTITETTAESVDIKEGTSAGVLRDNVFDGAGLRGDADSWVDVKGNNWLVQHNRGTSATGSGFQVHGVLPGWGMGNVFEDNIADVQGPGYGFELRPVADNVVACSNVAVGAAMGLSNAACR